MTKAEAQELENKCDMLMSETLGVKCFVSASILDRLRVSFGEHFINVSSDLSQIQYFQFYGYYDEFEDYCKDILKCIDDNREVFEKLMWSYKNSLLLAD